MWLLINAAEYVSEDAITTAIYLNKLLSLIIVMHPAPDLPKQKMCLIPSLEITAT